LIEKTCRIVFDATRVKTDIVVCDIEERWLCLTCGNPFTPAVSKVEPWHLRAIKYKRPRDRKIAKAEIIREFFNIPKETIALKREAEKANCPK